MYIERLAVINAKTQELKEVAKKYDRPSTIVVLGPLNEFECKGLDYVNYNYSIIIKIRDWEEISINDLKKLFKNAKIIDNTKHYKITEIEKLYYEKLLDNSSSLISDYNYNLGYNCPEDQLLYKTKQYIENKSPNAECIVKIKRKISETWFKKLGNKWYNIDVNIHIPNSKMSIFIQKLEKKNWKKEVEILNSVLVVTYYPPFK